MPLTSIEYSSINDMCPVANTFSLGARVQNLDSEGSFSSAGHVHQGVEEGTTLAVLTDHGISICTETSGVYKISTEDHDHWGNHKWIYTRGSSAVYVAVSTGGAIGYNETSYCYAKITTQEAILDLFRLSATQWLLHTTSRVTFSTST